MNLKAELLAGVLTIGTTFIFTDFLLELIIGVVVYFTSRILYKHYGDCASEAFGKLKQSYTLWRERKKK